MFCFQCQETAQNKGCTLKGVCGKTEDVANLQDLLFFIMKGISRYSVLLREKGDEVPEVNKFVADGLFMTITNANFDKKRFEEKIKEAFEIREKVYKKLLEKGLQYPFFTDKCDCTTWKTDDLSEMAEKAKKVGILTTENEDIRSLRE
jgi:hydroxylamine reductase